MQVEILLRKSHKSLFNYVFPNGSLFYELAQDVL